MLSLKDLISHQQKERALGKALDSYMRFRAAHEGVGYDLTPEFFENYIRAGVANFFGVTFANGKLLSDEQFPAIFREWNRKSQLH